MAAIHLPAVLVADDDPDDRLLLQDAWAENPIANPLIQVGDGEHVLEYLRREGRYAGQTTLPRPGLIILDLNMPKKDGRETLREIRADPALRGLPVVILTTSKAEDDVARCYDLGANGFITKPVSFQELVSLVKGLGQYWFEIVRLPAATPV